MLTVESETAAPTEHEPRSTAGAPPRSAGRFWLLLLLPLVVGGGLRIVCGLIDDTPTTDATAYLRSGESIWEGNGFRREGEPELHFPPLIPVLLGGAAEVFGDPLTGLVVVTIVTGTLALVPLAGVGRFLGGDRSGLAVAWVGALCPALATVASNQGGGSEGPYLLLVLSGLWLALLTTRRRGAAAWAGALGAGLCTGLAYLMRPEGIFFAVVFVPVVAVGALGGVAALRRRSGATRRWGAAAVLVALFGVGLVACAGPYVDYLHTRTGSWQLTAKARDASLDAWRAVAEHDRRARDQIFYRLDADRESFVAGRYTLAELVRDDPAGYAGIVGVNLRTAAREIARPEFLPYPSWELLPLPLMLLGGWAAWRRRRRAPALAVLATAVVALAVPLGFFVQPRYLAPTVAIACVFVGLGLTDLPVRWRRPALAVTVVLLAFSLLAGLGGLHHFLNPREQVEHRVAGEWLHDNTPPGTRVMTRSLVVDYYADRVMIPMPYSSMSSLLHYARAHGVDYVVADEYQLRSQRPHFHRLFEPGPWPGLRVVWTDHQDGRLTRIFALDPPAEGDGGDAPSDVGFVGDQGG